MSCGPCACQPSFLRLASGSTGQSLADWSAWLCSIVYIRVRDFKPESSKVANLYPCGYDGGGWRFHWCISRILVHGASMTDADATTQFDSGCTWSKRSPRPGREGLAPPRQMLAMYTAPEVPVITRQSQSSLPALGMLAIDDSSPTLPRIDRNKLVPGSHRCASQLAAIPCTETLP